MKPTGPLPGVMDGQYARDRATRAHLAFRAAFRAKVAVDAFNARHHGAGAVHVLELGAAEGLTLAQMRHLLGRPGDSIGVEASDELLAQAVPSVELVKGDVMDLPARVPAAYFQLCTALAVLEHLPSPEKAMASAFRCLAPGGVFVATCPHPRWDEIAARLRLTDDDSHLQHLSLMDLVELLGDTGFVQVETQRFMFAPVALLPYFGLRFDPALAIRIDGWLRPLRVFDAGFVNQAIVAVKPAA